MIDHRRLVRDIYDQNLLQGLSKSRSSSRNEIKKKAESGKTSKRKHSLQSNSRAAESVLSLWNDEFDDSLVMDSRRRRDVKLRRDDEEGRYAIEERRPKKLRKQERDADVHTVFTDDDASDCDLGSSQSSSSEREGTAYKRIDKDSRRGAKLMTRLGTTAKMEGRRSYWLSKGSGRGDEIEYDYE